MTKQHILIEKERYSGLVIWASKVALFNSVFSAFAPVLVGVGNILVLFCSLKCSTFFSQNNNDKLIVAVTQTFVQMWR
ncbi:hypothetical protein EGR_06927 [Echinococcus granulosus]|uniref:Uncharacterized protein n=1 Tax=Echinococcus granulosus TaxID=6210 RepID=W6U9X2_ECHGR|nr:hypothetical protein EGR_06927 [Echinococcus granulosus]EUB58183.1 hypothetical protein EGR_06927 [Echinococcus granulosus]